MTIPATPEDDITLVGEVNGNAYNASTNPRGMAEGGHRQNWAPAMNAIASIANWIASIAVYLTNLADQVAEDAASAAAGSGTESSVANIRSGASAQYLSIRRIYEANAPVALTDGASIAWNMADGINFEVTIGAAGRAMANPSNKVVGKSGILIVKQDATGGRSITTWGSDFMWVGDPPFWPTAANAESLITYIVRPSGKILLNFGGSTS